MKKKLLDKAPEIVAALWCCSKRGCGDCPYQGRGISCKYHLMSDAAALIEAYAAQLAAVTAERDGLQAKYDRLNDFERTQSAKLLARLGAGEGRA